jgi:hypothetical protein
MRDRAAGCRNRFSIALTLRIITGSEACCGALAVRDVIESQHCIT